MDLFAIGLITPLFGTHLRGLGASNFLIGIIASSYSGIQVISGPLIGSWSDVRDRKVVLMISLLFCAVCYLSLGIFSSIFCIFLIRLLLGFMKHTQSICKAMVSDLFPPDKHSELLSRTAVLGTIGFNIGPLFGGFISELSNGFTLVCTLTFILFLMNIFLSSLLPSFKKRHEKGDELQVKSLGIKQELLKIGANIKNIDWPQSWHLFAMRFLSSIATALFFYNQTFYMKEFFNLSQRHIGYVITFSGTIQTITVYSLSYLNQMFYKNEPDGVKCISHFFLLMSIASLLLCFANQFTYFLICIIPFVISSSVLRISTTQIVLEKCDKDKIGTYGGVSYSFVSIAKFIVPTLSGIVSDSFSNQASIVLSFIPAITGVILTSTILKKKNKEL